MRHRVVKKTLGRNKDQRRALITGLAAQLIENGRINTTLAKAKVLRPYVEKLVTKAVKASKSGDKLVTFNTVKLLKKRLRSESAIRKLLEDVAPKFVGRPGGYTRIVKTGNRGGDNASMARIEFVVSTSTEKTKAKEIKAKEVESSKKAEKTEKKVAPEKADLTAKAEKKDEKNTK